MLVIFWIGLKLSQKVWERGVRRLLHVPQAMRYVKGHSATKSAIKLDSKANASDVTIFEITA
jgi:hypothetical protein